MREIQNCLDYLGSLGKKNVTRDDLPPYMMDRTEADGRRKKEGEKGAQTAERCKSGDLESGARPAGAGGCQGACPRGKGNRAPVDCGISEKRGGVASRRCGGARDFKRIGGGGTDRNSSGERRSAPETLNGFYVDPNYPNFCHKWDKWDPFLYREKVWTFVERRNNRRIKSRIFAE